MKPEFCPICKNQLKLKKAKNQVVGVMKCKQCNKTFKITYDEKTFPSNINSFNWGAFLLWRFWGFWNGLPMLSLFGLLILNYLESRHFILLIFFFFTIDLSISFYLGFKGNLISWKRKSWSSLESFEEYQKKWTIAGITVLCFIIIISLLMGLGILS